MIIRGKAKILICLMSFEERNNPSFTTSAPSKPPTNTKPKASPRSALNSGRSRTVSNDRTTLQHQKL